MKNKFQKLGAFAFAAMTIVGFASCGGDDNNGGGGMIAGGNGSSTQAGVLSPELPKRLSAIKSESSYGTNYYYNYLADGRISNIVDQYSYYSKDSIIFNPAINQFVLRIYSGESIEQEFPMAIGFNPNGCISNVAFTYTYEDEAELDINNATVNFIYDANGRLLQSVGYSTGTATYIEEGIQLTIAMQSNLNNVFNWQDGKLTAITTNTTASASVAGFTETIIEERTVAFGYEQEYPNKYCQYAPFMNHYVDWIEVDGLYNVGLYGRGPAMLPSSYSVTASETYAGEKREWTEGQGTFQYRLNADGSIAWMKDGSDAFNFYYDDLTAGAPAKARNFVVNPEASLTDAPSAKKNKPLMVRLVEKIRANGMAK